MVHGSIVRALWQTAAAALAFAFLPLPCSAQTAAHVVISEVYGGGGNAGALYTHDFIELYNPTSSDVVMNGWSVQYQSGGGTGPFGAVAVFSGTIRARGFFLIQANPGSGGTTPLPPPDAVAGFAMAAGSGKVALRSDSTPVSTPADTGVVDFTGYGTANLFEGSGPAIAPGNTISVERKAGAGSDAASMSPGGPDEFSGNGYDSNDNADDFIKRDPDPQNDASPAEPAGGSVSVDAAYGEKWNLVSVPVLPADSSAEVLFPGGMTALYGYDGGYSAEPKAVPGRGYWIRFPEAETLSFTGGPLNPDTIELADGWNLIGSASIPVPAGEVIQEPEGHVPGSFYGYVNGYVPADTIQPGRAYWVRSVGGGVVILGGAPPPGIEERRPDWRAREEGGGDRSQLPPPPPE